MILTGAESDGLPAEQRGLFLAACERMQAGDARAALVQALKLVERHQRFAPGWHLAGVAALQAGDLASAIDALERGARLAPQDGELASNLAAAYLRANRHADAEHAAARAHALLPQKAGPLLNRSTALKALGRLDEAVQCVERALALDAERPEAWNHLGRLYLDQGRPQAALGAFDGAVGRSSNLREAFSNRLAALQLDPEQTLDSLLSSLRDYSQRYEFQTLARYQPAANEVSPGRPLRVGYVSPDAGGEVSKFIRSVLLAHDTSAVQTFCYCEDTRPFEADPPILARAMIRGLGGLSDEQVAAGIRADAIDILVDLAGHAGKNRLGVFMLRPAPIQMTWPQIPGGTGLLSMDYRITDAETDPPTSAKMNCREALLRLPCPQWCWEPPANSAELTPLPALSSLQFSLGSFNEVSKLSDATMRLWASVLARYPEARLVIAGAAPGLARERIIAALKVDVRRLTFLPALASSAYRQAIAGVDLMLDPVPQSGTRVTLEALWQGVPVVTLPGANSASRSSASIARALELDAFVARDAEDYLAIVGRFVADRAELAAIRAGLRERLRRSSLIQAVPFTRALEEQYRRVWLAWCGASEEPVKPASSKAATISAPRWRLADLAWRRAKEDLARGDLEQGIGELTKLLATHQNWVLALEPLAQAALLWAQKHPSCLEELLPRVAPARPTPLVSIIMCSIDAARLAAASASYRERFAGFAHEIIAIGDARSLSEGFNRGARQAAGEILIFSHDDVQLLTPDFATRLHAHLQTWDGVGVCGSSRLASGYWAGCGQPYLHGHIVHQAPGETELSVMIAGCQSRVHQVQCLDGVFVAVRRQVWEAIPYDEQLFDGFHLYDLDFSFRASLAGFRLGVPLDLTLLHRSLGSFRKDWSRYAGVFERKFAGKLALRTEVIPGCIHHRIETFEEMQRLLAALHHFAYGAARA